MATVTSRYYQNSRRPQAQPQNRQRRQFGAGLDAPAKRPPSGPGWFNPNEVENRADRLSAAELRALGRQPRVTDDGPHFSSYGQPNLFAAFLRAEAVHHDKHGSPHSAWLAQKLRDMADEAEWLGANDGETYEERDAVMLEARR